MVTKKPKKAKSKPTVKDVRYKEFKFHCPVCLKGYSYNRKMGCAEHDEFTALLPGPPPSEETSRSIEEDSASRVISSGDAEAERPGVAPPDANPSEDEPTADEEEFSEATRRYMVRNTEPVDTGKMITEKQWQGLFRLPTDWLNSQLKKWPPDSDYKELAMIWIMEDQELNDIATMIYNILKAYAPQFLVWLGGEGFMNIIAMIIALIMMFGPRVSKTLKFFSNRKKVRLAREEAKKAVTA